MTRAVITDHNFPDLEIEAPFAAEPGIDVVDASAEGVDVAEALRGADVVLNMFFPLTRELLATLAEGAVVVRYGVGVDNVDIEAARELGVAVSNIPDYGASTVADHAVALLLASLRHVGSFNAAVQEGEWPAPPHFGPIAGFAQSTVGLVGTGRIGTAVAARLRAFDFTVIAYDPYVAPEAAAAASIELVGFDELLARSDAISLHLPLTEETRHLVGADALARMRPNAVVVNTARGPLVDVEALAAAVREGRIAGAGLDVLEAEPLPTASPIRGLPNVLLTPHVAFYSEASLLALRRMAIEEARRHLAGEPRRNPVV
jgi:D-3-phosphoglycerate dehydrogenase / 2-oxoglutarate reductase